MLRKRTCEIHAASSGDSVARAVARARGDVTYLGTLPRLFVTVASCIALVGLAACESSDLAPKDDSDTDSDEGSAAAHEGHDAGSTSKADAGKSTSKGDAGKDAGRTSDAGSKADAESHHEGDDDEPSTGDDAGASSGPRDHCVDGEQADPNDGQLTGKPDQWKDSRGAIDLALPSAVLEWMDDRAWKPSHDAWHNIRRCSSGFGGGGFGGIFGGGGTGVNICSHTELIPADQECENAEDGYQFLVMHRHMMQALRQAFPEHTELFEGFPTFPYQAKDVPTEWQGRFGTGWSQSILQVAQTLEEIESNLSQFATEGDLGRYIQCGGMANGASSVHGALHFKWVVAESPNSLGNQTVNIGNYMFWKLHGWIDNIWERYRIAKGLAPDEPKLKEALVSQCREMHELGKIVGSATGGGMTEPLPDEAGFFHESVRPILEETCSSCHNESSPEAGLPLGGDISSANIVKALVNVTATRGGQFKRVVPGDASKSWLYLKVAGTAMSAGCQGANCNAQVMPPTGQVTLSQSELDTIEQWINDGAPAPTQP